MEFIPLTAIWSCLVPDPVPALSDSLTRSIESLWFHLTGSPRDRSSISGSKLCFSLFSSPSKLIPLAQDFDVCVSNSRSFRNHDLNLGSNYPEVIAVSTTLRTCALDRNAHDEASKLECAPPSFLCLTEIYLHPYAWDAHTRSAHAHMTLCQTFRV